MMSEPKPSADGLFEASNDGHASSSSEGSKSATEGAIPPTQPPADVPVPLGKTTRHWSDGLIKKRGAGITREDGKRELTEEDAYDKLGYSWPKWKKWTYLCAVAFVQVSMNFNTSVYPNAVKPLSSAFQIGQQEARTGQMIYLVLYSIGCELWAPWSEEFGRWPILQLSMFLINIWQIPCMVAPNWGTIVVARGLVRWCPSFSLIVTSTNILIGWSFHCRW